MQMDVTGVVMAQISKFCHTPNPSRFPRFATVKAYVNYFHWVNYFLAALLNSKPAQRHLKAEKTDQMSIAAPLVLPTGLWRNFMFKHCVGIRLVHVRPGKVPGKRCHQKKCTQNCWHSNQSRSPHHHSYLSSVSWKCSLIEVRLLIEVSGQCN
jgi:hypothetical protein